MQGSVCDLMWSDPTTSTPTWALNERGAGYVFGTKVAGDFNHLNGLNLIARAHQLAMEGYSYAYGAHDPSVVTVSLHPLPAVSRSSMHAHVLQNYLLLLHFPPLPHLHDLTSSPYLFAPLSLCLSSSCCCRSVPQYHAAMTQTHSGVERTQLLLPVWEQGDGHGRG